MTEREFCQRLNEYEEWAENNLTRSQYQKFRKEVDLNFSITAPECLRKNIPLYRKFLAYETIYLDAIRNLSNEDNDKIRLTDYIKQQKQIKL